MKSIAVVAMLTLTGCASMPTPEGAWLVVDAIDTAQTITIAQSPRCLHEKDPMAAFVYGSKHPSVRRVVLTNVALGVLHWGASRWVEKRDDWWKYAFYGVSFGYSGLAVGNNMVLGIRPMAGDSCARSVTAPSTPLPGPRRPE